MLAAVHRRVFLPVYVPALLLGIPSQAASVLLPLHVLGLGGSAAQAAAVVGLRGIGMMAMDIPAGMLGARFGEKAIMLLATALIGLAFVGYALCDEVAWFYAIAFLNGAGNSTFLLGRMSFIAACCAPGERGRVIAMLAGSLRAAALLGPLAGGALAQASGYTVTFGCAAVAVILALACVFAFAPKAGAHARALNWRSIASLVVAHRRLWSTAGVAAVSFMLMREARTTLLPLLGAGIGLDAAAIGFIVATSAAVDIAFFYPAGVIMDKFGRRATAVPSSLLFVLTLAALALVQGYYSLLALAIAAGIANGLSTGIVMTLGTDLAPPAQRSEFLGLWRLLTDFGSAAGPLIISAVVASATLGVAALGVAAIGAAGSFVVYRFVEETLPR